VKAGATVRGACFVVVAALMLLPSSARGLEFSAEGNSVELLDAAGNPETRAGAHPDRFVQRISLVTGEGAEDAKELVIDLPPGLSGSADAVPFCSREAWAEFLFGPPFPCSEEEGVGVLVAGGEEVPIYSLEPAPNELAVFGGFLNTQFSLRYLANLRPDDQGLSLRLTDLLQVGFNGGKLELWGVPADHQVGTSIPRRALLTTPTECAAEPPVVRVRANTWQHPDVWTTKIVSFDHAFEDCSSLPFSPTAAFAMDDQRADVSSGADLTVTVPQQEDPDRRATSMVRGLSVAMPEGVTVSPGGAAGVSACADREFGIGSAEDPACPLTSKVGSAQIQPAGGGGGLSGSIYLGEEHPGDRFRLLVAAGGRGALLKFVGSLKVDAVTGRVTVDIDDLPRSAFESLSLRFRGGPRSLLATPLDCGAAPTSARFTPYSGTAPVEWRGSLDIVSADGAPCGSAQFAPSVEAESTVHRAGRTTSFRTTVRRADGEQLPADMTIDLPAGVGAAVGTVDKCGAGAADGDCPPGSRIGQVLAELGPGDHPARIDGDVYLTGRYRGAPYGIALVFDAAVGPFDLGALVIRGALRFDLDSGRAKVEVKSLPSVFEGLPVRFQSIGLNLDRPGFMINPTSCSTGAVSAKLRSQEGTLAEPSSPFTVRGCLGLRFRPQLSVALGPQAEMRRGGHPSLRMSLRSGEHSTNVSSAEVRLPSVLELDTSGVKQLCPRRRAMEGRCPKLARIGAARAQTPLLRGRMKGSLYLVQPRGDGLPDIWASIAGQGLELNLRTKTEVEDGQAVAKFVNLPDFPMRALVLRFFGGDNGLLKLDRRPCGRLSTPARIDAQDGRRLTVVAPVALPSRCEHDG
jgi:hypothetical protein